MLVDLPMFRKNSYRLLFGPTNEAGVVVITREDVSDQAREIVGLFPMDYIGLGPDWNGEVLLRPANLRAIERLRLGFATWGGTGIYPIDFLEQLEALQRQLDTVAPSTMIKLSLLSDPGGDADIRISSLLVGEPELPQ